MPDPADGIFRQRVASGDPRTGRVVIWTRVTVEEGREPTVTWWLKDTSPNGRRQTGTIKALAERDWTVSIGVRELEPGQRYEYGCEVYGERSEVGRTRTLPA